MSLYRISSALLDAVIAIAAMGFISHIVWNYIDQKTRAEARMEGDDAPFLAAVAIVFSVIVALVAFGAIGWLAG